MNISDYSKLYKTMLSVSQTPGKVPTLKSWTGHVYGYEISPEDILLMLGDDELSRIAEKSGFGIALAGKGTKEFNRILHEANPWTKKASIGFHVKRYSPSREVSTFIGIMYAEKDNKVAVVDKPVQRGGMRFGNSEFGYNPRTGGPGAYDVINTTLENDLLILGALNLKESLTPLSFYDLVVKSTPIFKRKREPQIGQRVLVYRIGQYSKLIETFIDRVPRGETAEELLRKREITPQKLWDMYFDDLYIEDLISLVDVQDIINIMYDSIGSDKEASEIVSTYIGKH